MTFTYQGPAHVEFSVGSKFQYAAHTQHTSQTLSLTEVVAGTFEACFIGTLPDFGEMTYVRIVLPDGTEHGGRITQQLGSMISFLSNVMV